MSISRLAQPRKTVLEATAFGLGSVFIGAFDDEAVRKTLTLSAEYAPLGLVPVGYRFDNRVRGLALDGIGDLDGGGS